MKKFFTIFAMVLAMATITSCDPTSNASADLYYDVTATAEGQVEFTWPAGGYANIDGKAVVSQSNDTLAVFQALNAPVLTLEEGLESEDPKVASAAQDVSQWFTVNGVAGQYHLTIKGYVKFGPMIFAIDEEYPKPTPEPVVE